MLSHSHSLTFMSSHVLCLLPGTLSWPGWLLPVLPFNSGVLKVFLDPVFVGLCICPPAMLKIPISHSSIKQVHGTPALGSLQNPTFLPPRAFIPEGTERERVCSLSTVSLAPAASDTRRTPMAIFLRTLKTLVTFLLVALGLCCCEQGLSGCCE